ncbi:hypothetical protein F5141DRAFT_1120763 [Pisolithus sp. B1]|nr:hypothetical protein F5141DRAFT_1120763 [Pisolithus sp. B1]
MKRDVYAGEIQLICVLVFPWLLLVREREGSLTHRSRRDAFQKVREGSISERCLVFSGSSLSLCTNWSQLPLHRVLRTLVSIFLAVSTALALATAICTADYTFGLDCCV